MTDNDIKIWEACFPIGWVNAFCPQMWEDLKTILRKYDYLEQFQLIDIKEKFGHLDISPDTFDMSDELEKEISGWADDLWVKSWETCSGCGRPATGHTKGWVLPFCDDCARDYGFEIT